MEKLNSRVLEIRKDFPLLMGSDLAYLDNAATTQKPQCVLDAWKNYYENMNANPMRGVYELSEVSTQAYEDAREAVATFIGAQSASEIVFTRNATESLNLLAYTYGMQFLKPGDEFVVSVCEHHSNFLPWKMVAEKTGATLKCLKCEMTGEITDEALASVITDKTKLVAVTQVSNVFGRINNIRHIADMVHAVGGVIVVDGSQSVPHMKVNVQELGADFLAFSGHKLYAPMGIGVLYGRYELLEKTQPFLRGGEMIEIVHWDRVKFTEVPHKFEAGTVNAGGAVALHAAIDYVNSIGMDFIHAWELELTARALEGMKNIGGVNIIGTDEACDHNGIVTFTVDGVHPHDVASIMSADGVAIRAGHHCAQPLMDHLGVRSTSRVSLSFYNTEEEVDRFLTCLSSIRRRMGFGE